MDWLLGVYDLFNARLFEGVLPKVKIEACVGRRCIFHYLPPDTLEVGSEIVGASTATVFDDLVHVQCHIRNRQQGVPDYTTNQYHNANFSAMALSVGLCVAQQKSRGWGVTFTDKAQCRRHAKHLCPEDAVHACLIEIYGEIEGQRRGVNQVRRAVEALASQKPTKQYLLKYACNCAAPYNTVRSGRHPTGAHPLDITCNGCRTKFIFVPESGG